MKPQIAFWTLVLFSELSQWAIWKANNSQKRWRDWSGRLHLMSNFGVVLLVNLLWDAQLLDDLIAGALSYVGIAATMQWDKLLPLNVSCGAILGYATDKFGDQLSRAAGLLGPAILGKAGALIDRFKPPTTKPPDAAEGTP